MNNPYDNRTLMSKASKRLINDLIAQAESYTQSFPMYAPKYRKTFKAGTMSVSCIDSKEAVQSLITRLKKGLTAKAGTFQTRPASILATTPFKTAIKEFLQDDEIDNAINYALLKNKLDDLKFFDFLTNEQRLYINEYCYKLAA
jgi:hypothetical protein